MSQTTHNTLGTNEWLLSGNSLWSTDGSVEFKMQGDGKIAVYWGGQLRFQNTKDQRNDIKGLKMQEDGNLVLYDNSGNAVWHSNTASNSHMTLHVQNDGNVVLYKGSAVWDTKTSK